MLQKRMSPTEYAKRNLRKLEDAGYLHSSYDRFKEIEQYKLYRKDDKGYLLVVNALGLDKEHLNVVLEYANSLAGAQ